ncbi:hypothetical protein BDU57DRAFT_583121 [Ampelomyces quisqualis]|uniref:AMP-dependent synthetase/ligase domain-containing protein n=1 Tax=Ampelomyces quisqualis TaxID=50730 RepID=A0A6A5QBB0_AMPQU|nr:hypothetical protein BDU57DRAFT_583121 [Ampelomyces quisqualis]
MPFPAEDRISVPNNYLLSWMFDEQMLIYCFMIFTRMLSFGGIFAGVNLSYTPYELTHAFKTAKFKALMVEAELLPGALKAAVQAKILRFLIFAFDHHNSVNSCTTGLLKAVEMTHYNFIAQHTMVVRPLFTPILHVSNVPRAHISPLCGGMKTYFMPRFELESLMRNIERFQITEANMVPPMALLRLDAPFNQVWGISETSYIETMVHYPEHDSTGSVDRFLPNHDAKLVDDEGRNISDFEVAGELCVRGPLIVKGYFNDGYFYSGESILRCEGKMLGYGTFFVSQKGAHQSSRPPAEPEGVLLSRVDISDAAVIGIPAGGANVRAGGQGTELTCACIVSRQDSRMTKDQSRRHKQLLGGILKKDLSELRKNRLVPSHDSFCANFD